MIVKLKFNPNSEMTRIVKLFIFLLVLIQVMGWVWIKVGLNTENPGNWIAYNGYQENDYFEIYLHSLFFAAITIATVGYGSFAGTLTNEYIYITICIIVGSIYYSFFVSIVGNMFSNMSMRSSMINKYVGYIEQLKRNFNIPDELEMQLRYYYENLSRKLTTSERDKKYDFYDIMNIFPKIVQHQVRMQINQKAIEVIKFLNKRENDFYEWILPMLSSHKFPIQSFLFKEGQIATHLYMIVEGEVLNMITRMLISEGNLIGEVDIIKSRKRQETLIAAVDWNCLKIERFDFLNILKEFPEIEKEVLEIAEEKEKFLQPFLEERKRLNKMKAADDDFGRK